MVTGLVRVTIEARDDCGRRSLRRPSPKLGKLRYILVLCIFILTLDPKVPLSSSFSIISASFSAVGHLRLDLGVIVTLITGPQVRTRSLLPRLY